MSEDQVNAEKVSEKAADGNECPQKNPPITVVDIGKEQPKENAGPADTHEKKRKRKPLSCFEIWTVILAAVGILVAGATGIAIYKQDQISSRTLDEMKKSGAQTTDQVWRAISNLNWMAQSMDYSQKQAKVALDETLREMQRQTSAQKEQSAVALRQDQRTEQQLAAHLVIENFNVDYADLPKTKVSFDVFNDGGSSATEVTETQWNGGFSPLKSFKENFNGIDTIPKRTDPIGATIPKGERRHFTIEADWIGMRNGRTPLEWFAWWRFTYLKEPRQEGEIDSLCVLATGSKHGIAQRSCEPPPIPKPQSSSKKGK